MDDWGEAWELPVYPTLPKLFTNAKTAKKRKHKEYIVTDELLEQPVKLPRQGRADKKASKQQQPHNQAASASAVDAAAPGVLRKFTKQKERKSKDAKDRKTTNVVGAESHGVATTGNKQQKHKRDMLGTCEADADLNQGGLQQHQHQQQNGHVEMPSAAAPVSRKVKKHKKKQVATAAEQGVAATVPTGTAAAPADAPASNAPKKSKNKFKQPEFLQQIEQQANKQQQKAQQPQRQCKKQEGQQQQQQAQAETAPAGGSGATQAVAGQKSKRKCAGSNAPVLSAAAPTSKGKTPAGSKGGGKPPATAGGTPAAAAAACVVSKPKAPSSASTGSNLLQQFKERLQGSRFRQLNEALYTQPGDKSFAMLQEQPELFEQYHEGFQHQVKLWPAQPLDAAISWLAGKPASMVVADFGCGDARLAATVQQQVHSLDLVGTGPGVIACNMAHTPLGSGSCDAAVFSLALMGVDYGAFLVEAARVVKQQGWLWIAEVRSRFMSSSGTEDFRPFLNCLQLLGFKLVKQDAKNRMFVVFVLRKQQQVAAEGAESLNWPLLKACVYKKR